MLMQTHDCLRALRAVSETIKIITVFYWIAFQYSYNFLYVVQYHAENTILVLTDLLLKIIAFDCSNPSIKNFIEDRSHDTSAEDLPSEQTVLLISFLQL